MSIATDRAAIKAALIKTLPDWTVRAHAPQEPAGMTCWLELANIDPGLAFGTLELTWKIIATAMPSASTPESLEALDAAADAIISGIHGEAAADIEHAPAYYGLTTANGVTFPSFEITVKSLTRIGKE